MLSSREKNGAKKVPNFQSALTSSVLEKSEEQCKDSKLEGKKQTTENKADDLLADNKKQEEAKKPWYEYQVEKKLPPTASTKLFSVPTNWSFG